MKMVTIILMCCCIAAGCNNKIESNSHETAVQDTSLSGSMVQQPVTTACYGMMNASDTVRVQLIILQDSVSGSMTTQYEGKDKNTGLLVGAMKGDTLYANYTFHSEGIQSVREVAFLRQGDQLLEGFGKVVEQEGKMVFAQPADLRFGTVVTLAKQPCQ